MGEHGRENIYEDTGMSFFALISVSPTSQGLREPSGWHLLYMFSVIRPELESGGSTGRFLKILQLVLQLWWAEPSQELIEKSALNYSHLL
jgi:hypothetical protein